MRLVSVGLRGRRFLIQFGSIIDEFGQEIPWLSGMDSLRYATNSDYFRDRLLRSTVGSGNGDITAYQFIEPGVSREFIGGALHFTHSPERFKDHHNQYIQERLTHEGFSFITCFQVRSIYQHHGIGGSMMPRAVNAMLREHGSIWGVVSRPALLPWYEAYGARIESPQENKDRLWIISWNVPLLPT